MRNRKIEEIRAAIGDKMHSIETDISNAYSLYKESLYYEVYGVITHKERQAIIAEIFAIVDQNYGRDESKKLEEFCTNFDGRRFDED